MFARRLFSWLIVIAAALLLAGCQSQRGVGKWWYNQQWEVKKEGEK